MINLRLGVFYVKASRRCGYCKKVVLSVSAPAASSFSLRHFNKRVKFCLSSGLLIFSGIPPLTGYSSQYPLHQTGMYEWTQHNCPQMYFLILPLMQHPKNIWIRSSLPLKSEFLHADTVLCTLSVVQNGLLSVYPRYRRQKALDRSPFINNCYPSIFNFGKGIIYMRYHIPWNIWTS